MTEPVERRRRYRSDSRREGALATRRRILDAARRRFVARGWSGTAVAAVAADAGVAPETVYATFRTKAALLEALVREAARGEEDIDILDQEGHVRVAAASGRREQLRLFAEDVAARLERVGPLVTVVAGAAASEPALGEVHRRVHAARLSNLRTLPAALARGGPLLMDEDAAAETVWALASPELHALLTGVRGWDRERYAGWLAGCLATLLLPGHG